jgi:hypothetical protein
MVVVTQLRSYTTATNCWVNVSSTTFLLPVNHAATCVIEFDIATAGIGVELKGRVSQGDGGHRIKAPSQRDPRGMAVDLKRVRCAAQSSFLEIGDGGRFEIAAGGP